jgi:hypothetical protein
MLILSFRQVSLAFHYNDLYVKRSVSGDERTPGILWQQDENVLPLRAVGCAFLCRKKSMQKLRAIYPLVGAMENDETK